ncbi:DUF4931 domain-containing protein [Lactobacillus sp. PV034]|uniref:DUF4931 domain-containing protein n=1 Tax=Lactobacillus sp. PV034 TaxID=2594495 RepID=UPI00223F4D35|nr:DUF4931 domain-containing protein [Lactobacillus sp. PV034]QNQ81236.1 DUF4931 domain-containing protein [Lactobacillus sp. PV034]
MNNDPLVFKLATAKNKPSSFRKDKSHSCPFCDVASLDNIYQKEGDLMWLHNRFPTLKDTLQTVLIESADHNGDISNYTKAHNRKLMKFALQCFNEVISTNKYQSVLWYKNFGPLSRGSLVHPHMQIVGLEHEDGYKYIHKNNFTGISVFENERVEVNMALHPVQGYQEININLNDSQNDVAIDNWADWIQIATQYTLQEMYHSRCTSYNLFFYPYESNGKKRICAKLIPRFYAPPYFVGYKLSQRNDKISLEEEGKKLFNFNLMQSK